MTTWKRITIDPNVLGGKPCIRGLLITVENIACMFAAGQTAETALRLYPYLEKEDIEEALAYAETSGDPSLDFLKGNVMKPVKWDIRLQGRVWNREEFEERWGQMPEKVELHEGKMFFSEEERLHVLGMLIEHVGAEKAVQLGNPEVWKAAVAKI